MTRTTGNTSSNNRVLKAGDTMTGALTAPIKDKGGQVYNVKAYGAVGDGSTDDKTAIDNAIAAANSNGYGTVYFPAANYVTSGAHKIYGNLRYDLGWATIKLKNSSNTDIFITDAFATNTGTNNTTDPANWSMVNGYLQGNSANQSSGDGIKIYGHNYILENIFVTDCKNDGIYSEWGNVGTLTPPTNNMEAHIINVKSSSNGGWGINFNGPHDSILDTVTCYSNTTGQFNFSGGSAGAAGTRAYNCHEYLTTPGGVNLAAEMVEWINSTAEVTSPGVAIKMLSNETKVVGGMAIDPNAGASTGIQIGDGTHTPADTYVDTVIQTTDTASIYFYASGGYNSVRAKVFQTGGTVVTGTPVATDNVTIAQGSQDYGLATGNVPQTNGSLIRMAFPDPTGTAGYYKLGTWYASSGSGGERLRLVINGTGGYNADAASAGRT